MGLDERSFQLDAIVSMQILADLRPLIGDLPAELVRVHCRKGEPHAGIRLGDDARGYHYLYRCAFKWWVKPVPASADGEGSGPPDMLEPLLLAEPLMRVKSPKRTPGEIVFRLGLA
jgi:hypothetical protein